MKKIVTLMLVVMMAVCFIAGCAPKAPADAPADQPADAPADTPADAPADEPAKDGEPAFKIGFPFSALLNDPTISACVNAVKTACEAAGGEMILDTCDTKAIDSYVTSMEKLISMGCNGLLILPPAESMIPTAIKMCEESNVYFSLCFSPIQDKAIEEMLYASDNFAGYCWIDDYEAGYIVMSELAELGCKNVAIMANPKGHLAGDNRYNGAVKAAEEKGITILTETRGLSAADEVAKAVESFIVAYPEIDGIFSTGVTWVDDATFKVMDQYGYGDKIKYGKIDFFKGMENYYDDGRLHVILGGHSEPDFQLSTCLLINKILGTPILDDDGKPLALKIEFLQPTDSEEMKNYFAYSWHGVPPFTADEIKDNFIKALNDEVTAKNFKDAAAAFCVEDLVTRHADIVDTESDVYTIEK